MALTNATTLADYGAGIGTQGATLKVDATNKRVGVGTDSPAGPEGSLQVGTGITFFGNTGIVSAIGGKFSGDFTVGGTLTYEDVANIDAVGIITAQSHVSIADSILHTGDTDTSIRFPAANTFTVETAGSEVLRVDSSQRLLVNKTVSTTSNGHSILQVASTSNDRTIAVHNFEDDANGPFISLGKSRGTSINSYTIVQDDDELGNIDFFGADGTDFNTVGARIQAEVDGIVGVNSLPGRLIFATTSGGANNPTERLRITSGGDLFVAGTGGMNTTQLNNGNTVNINGTSSNDGFSVIRYSTGYGAYGLNIGRSKSDTLGTNTAVTNGNDLGHVTFYGADGTDFNEAAQITAQVDGTPSDGTDMPGRLIFKTSPDGSATPTERLRIDSSGNLGLGESSSIDARLHVNSGTDNTTLFLESTDSDVNLGMADNSGSCRLLQSGGNLRFRTGGNANAFGTGDDEKMVLNSSGQLLIGTDTSKEGTSKLQCVSDSDATIFVGSTDVDASGQAKINFAPSNGIAGSQIICVAEEDFSVSANRTGYLKFVTRKDGTLSDQMYLSSDGNLRIGGNSDLGDQLLQIQGNSDAKADVIISRSGASANQTATLTFAPANNITGGRIQCYAEEDFSVGANRTARMMFLTRKDGTLDEKMRITSDGHVSNKTSGTITSVTTQGWTLGSLSSGGGFIIVKRDSSTPLYVNRGTNDGDLIELRGQDVKEGAISVSGATITYGQFLGSHWGRLEDDSKPEILAGTILETVNKLVEWKVVEFTVDGVQKRQAYNGSAEVGDSATVTYEGTSYSGTIANEQESLPRNKHVCVKVSDTAASKAVFGVFLGWDEAPEENIIGTWNDMNIGAIGNYFIRIKSGQSLEIGDLIESDGSGCGVVQSDDSIRSKTVAKVTSTIPQTVYSDGSFLVTCVLYSG